MWKRHAQNVFCVIEFGRGFLVIIGPFWCRKSSTEKLVVGSIFGIANVCILELRAVVRSLDEPAVIGSDFFVAIGIVALYKHVTVLLNTND